MSAAATPLQASSIQSIDRSITQFSHHVLHIFRSSIDHLLACSIKAANQKCARSTCKKNTDRT